MANTGALYLFLVIWSAIFIIASFPAFFLARKVRWQWKGQKDKFRTNMLWSAATAFFIHYVFETAYYAEIYRVYKAYENGGEDIGNYKAVAAVDLIGAFFHLVGLLSLAALFLRTAISLLYNLSSDQKLGLARVVELAGFVGLGFLVALAIAVWGVYVWYDSIFFVDADSTLEDSQGAFYTYTKLAVAYEWIYFAYATIFLPIVFLQVLGRRTDRIAMLLFTFAILMVDALHVVEVVQGLVSIHKREYTSTATSAVSLGLQIAVLVCESMFYSGALYCLAIMGMRDPKRLVGEDEPAFTPVAQQAWDNHDTKYSSGAYGAAQPSPGQPSPSELPNDTVQNSLLPQELPASEMVELPADHGVKPAGKFTRLFKR